MRRLTDKERGSISGSVSIVRQDAPLLARLRRGFFFLGCGVESESSELCHQPSQTHTHTPFAQAAARDTAGRRDPGVATRLAHPCVVGVVVAEVLVAAVAAVAVHLGDRLRTRAPRMAGRTGACGTGQRGIMQGDQRQRHGVCDDPILPRFLLTTMVLRLLARLEHRMKTSGVRSRPGP